MISTELQPTNTTYPNKRLQPTTLHNIIIVRFYNLGRSDFGRLFLIYLLF